MIPKPIQRWEYKVMHESDLKLEDVLNDFSDEGWTLINVPEREGKDDTSYFTLIFKRPK